MLLSKSGYVLCPGFFPPLSRASSAVASTFVVPPLWLVLWSWLYWIGRISNLLSSILFRIWGKVLRPIGQMHVLEQEYVKIQAMNHRVYNDHLIHVCTGGQGTHVQLDYTETILNIFQRSSQTLCATFHHAAHSRIWAKLCFLETTGIPAAPSPDCMFAAWSPLGLLTTVLSYWFLDQTSNRLFFSYHCYRAEEVCWALLESDWCHVVAYAILMFHPGRIPAFSRHVNRRHEGAKAPVYFFPDSSETPWST